MVQPSPQTRNPHDKVADGRLCCDNRPDPLTAKRFLPRLSLVVFLGGAARNQLHASGNNVWAGVLDQKMNINQIVSDLYFLHSMIVTV